MKKLRSTCILAAAAIGAALVSVFRPVAQAIEGYMHSNGLILSAIALTESRNDGQSQFYNARHLDDAGAPAAAVFYPGFRPRRVTVFNLTDRISYEWFEGMTGTHCLYAVAAGTRTLDTAAKIAVVVAPGSRPSITIAAAEVLQNKQYQIVATA
jgi:hypothetical protein